MQPLEGIRVVELATYIVAPMAARVMGDWGAEVIKVEAPSPDKWRTVGCLDGIPVGVGENPIYTVANSGKEMITLDLKTEEGKNILLRLLENADVFITNVRWAAIERMGLDYETLHARFPRLIYFHFTGFGYEGPDASRPGFDSAVFFGKTGLLADIPERGDRPTMALAAAGDCITSNCVLSGIMAALFHRERTGEGIRLTSSLYAAGIWTNFSHVCNSQAAYGEDKFPKVAAENPNPLSEIYECADGRWILLASDALQYEQCIKALDLEYLSGDERFNTIEALAQNQREFFDIITAQFKTRPADEWLPRLKDADVVYQKIMRASEVSECEQAWANNYLTHVDMRNGIRAVLPNSPVHFFGWDRPATTPAHGPGEDSSAVMARFGYSAEEIRALKEKGIVQGN